LTAQDTRDRFLRSSGAAILSQGWRVLVAFGVQLVLKRLVPAGDWGLYEWSLPVFMILGAVRDLGLVYHVVRAKPRPYGNLLALELVWGGILVGLTFVGAPLLASAYSEAHPEILNVLRAMTVFLLFEGLSTVPRTYFEGELKIGRAVAPEVVRNLFMAVVSVGMALAGFDLWALVIANVGSAVVYAIMLWWRAWGEIPLLYQRGRTLPLVLESLPLAAVWFLTILVRFVDPLILGWRFDGPTVGNYMFAYQNAFRASEVIVPALTRALYPALVAFRMATSKLFDAYRLATLFMQSIEVPVAYFLFLNADIALLILGGSQWVEAPTYLRILCFAPIIDPFTRLGGEVLKTEHMDKTWIVCTLITLATFVGGGIYLTLVMGPEGMAWINLLPLGAVFMAWALHRVSPAGFRALTSQLLYIYVVPVPFFAAVWFLATERPWLRFGLSLVAVAISLAIFWRRFGGDFRGFFRSKGGAAEVGGEL
jgi:O-antigen/teichoic acid export membrane protein